MKLTYQVTELSGSNVYVTIRTGQYSQLTYLASYTLSSFYP